jgi:hypothetical protein
MHGLTRRPGDRLGIHSQAAGTSRRKLPAMSGWARSRIIVGGALQYKAFAPSNRAGWAAMPVGVCQFLLSA